MEAGEAIANIEQRKKKHACGMHNEFCKKKMALWKWSDKIITANVAK